jgi:RNA polymerase sigma factor (sigma-70 family)
MKENIEKDLVEQAKSREPAAIAELYRHYWRAARATAYGVTGDFVIAEDAASEAFYAALDSLEDLRDTRRFGPWLRTIVVRTARHLKKTKSKAKGIELKTQTDKEVIEPSISLEQREIAALIHGTVGDLSETLREAMSMFYFEGYSIKEAAHFLDIPDGTLKRRLHEGRQRLREAAEGILKGARPLNPKREQILKQLNDMVNEDIHSEAFYQAMRQALRLRPVPEKLLKKVMQKHWAAKHTKTSVSAEKEHKLREFYSRIFSPSQRAQDTKHPVGAVANAIRSALPEFQPWQVNWSEVNISKIVRNISEGDEKALSFLRPPDFIEGSQGSYISAMRASLLQDEDGTFCTPYELMQKKETMEAMKAQIKQGKRLSDILHLLWKKPDPMELRTVEEVLRRLSVTIASTTPVRFCSYEEPRYRAALRMQIADNPIPAAIGGVLNSLPGLPDRVGVASVTIFLEPWATAQSGQVVELVDFPPLSSFLFEDNKNRQN